MELVLTVAVVLVVVVVTLVLMRRHAVGSSGETRQQRMSRELGDSLEGEYQAELRKRGSAGR